MICSACGKQSDSRYCPDCGAALEEQVQSGQASAEKQQEEQAAEQPAQTKTVVETTQVAMDKPENTPTIVINNVINSTSASVNENTNTTVVDNSKKRVLLVGGGVALVVIIVVLVVLFTRGGKSETPAATVAVPQRPGTTGEASSTIVTGGADEADNTSMSASDIVLILQQEGIPIGDYIIYNEETDENELLGRPNQYTSKVNFSDTRAKQSDPTDPVGGSVEVFLNAADAQIRHDYVVSVHKANPTLMQYSYLYDNVLLRIDKALTPSQAEEYEAKLKSLLANGYDGPIPTAAPPAELSISDYQVHITEGIYIAVVLENTTGRELGSLNVEATFMQDGAMISSTNSTYFNILPDQTLAWALPKPRDAEYEFVDFDDVQINFTIKPTSSFTTLTESVDYESNEGANGIVIRAQNNSTGIIDFAKFVVLFYRENQVVGISTSAIFTDMTAGSSATDEVQLPPNISGGTVESDAFETVFLGAIRY